REREKREREKRGRQRRTERERERERKSKRDTERTRDAGTKSQRLLDAFAEQDQLKTRHFVRVSEVSLSGDWRVLCSGTTSADDTLQLQKSGYPATSSCTPWMHELTASGTPPRTPVPQRHANPDLALDCFDGRKPEQVKVEQVKVEVEETPGDAVDVDVPTAPEHGHAQAREAAAETVASKPAESPTLAHGAAEAEAPAEAAEAAETLLDRTSDDLHMQALLESHQAHGQEVDDTMPRPCSPTSVQNPRGRIRQHPSPNTSKTPELAGKQEPPAGLPVASSLEEGLAFTDFYLDRLAKIPADELPDEFESGLELLAARMDDDFGSDSTSFSGVEAPHTSRRLLHYRLEQRLQRKIRPPSLSYAVEWNSHCQKELLHLMDMEQQGGSSDSCLFSDICDFFRDELLTPGGLISQLKQRPSIAVETLAPLLAQGALVKRRAFCLRHRILGSTRLKVTRDPMWFCV
ncbi:unnamed protein product, partial [Symbiodinium natans]